MDYSIRNSACRDIKLMFVLLVLLSIGQLTLGSREKISSSTSDLLHNINILRYGEQCDVLNDDCNNDNYLKCSYSACACIEGYFWPGGNSETCEKWKRFGEDCVNENDRNPCHPDSFSSCINGVCTCKESEWVEAIDNTCRVKINRTCHNRVPPIDQCIRNAECWYRKCKCVPGYSRSSTNDGICQGGYGMVCIGKTDCLDSFDCVDGRCGCKGGGSQVYKTEIDKHSCLGLVGSPCHSNVEENRQPCVPTSICNSSLGLCTCQNGYSEIHGITDKCYVLKQYTEACSAEECDFRKGYACINQKCNCVDTGLKFSGHENGCLASLGFKCGNYGLVRDKLSTEVRTTNTRGRNVCPAIVPEGCSNDCEYYSVACEPNTTCKEVVTYSSGKPRHICQI